MPLDKIMQGFKEVADNQTLLHEEAMIAAHTINLNGVKRMHRHHSRKFHEHGLCVDNFAQDYGAKIEVSKTKGGYNFASLKEHITTFIPKLEADIAKLQKLNREFLQEFGMEFKEGVCMQECLSKHWMKMKFRWLPRFEFTKWDPMDIMNWDKWLHDKIRCLEENHHHTDK